MLAENGSFMLIIATKQENSEDGYASNATPE